MFLLLIIFFIVVGFAVQSRLKSKFKQYGKEALSNGMSGAEIAQKMLEDHGIYDVKIQSVPRLIIGVQRSIPYSYPKQSHDGFKGLGKILRGFSGGSISMFLLLQTVLVQNYTVHLTLEIPGHRCPTAFQQVVSTAVRLR